MTKKNPAEPRKQPRQQRATFTFEAILEAAAHILESAGLPATTTNAIASQAGVSIGSLYQYFPAKEAILIELIRRERKKLLFDISIALQNLDSEPLEESVRKMLKAGVDHQLLNPALARALEFAELSLPLDSETAKTNESIIQMVTTLITHHQIKNPRQVAGDCVALSKGIIDAAGLAGEVDQLNLLLRTERAVLGYLRSVDHDYLEAKMVNPNVV